MPFFISVQLSKLQLDLPKCQMEKNRILIFQLVFFFPVFCFQFSFALGFSWFPGSYCNSCFWFKNLIWINLPDFLLACAQPACLYNWSQGFTDAVTFWIQQGLLTNRTLDSPEHPILKGLPLRLLFVYHGDSSLGDICLPWDQEYMATVMLRKYKQLFMHYTKKWHVMSIGGVKNL